MYPRKARKGKHMKPRVRTVPHDNYERKLVEQWRTGALPRNPGYHQVIVSHDDWCAIFAGGSCNCDPDIELKCPQSPAAQNEEMA
jgi:hypothetical protein